MVPSGQSRPLDAAISPASMARCVSGFVPTCETITRATAPAPMSIPMPTPGRAVSSAMAVRVRTPRATRASIVRFGVPTPMKPPIMIVAPSGTSAATACGVRL